MTTEKIYWGYARVSSAEQQQDSGALQKQIQRLQDAGCQKVYWDIISRRSTSRSGLNQLVQDLKSVAPGTVHCLKFTRLDRIGSSSPLYYSLSQTLKEKGIALTALDQNLDHETSGGELTIDVLLAAAKFEVNMLSQRVKSELKQRRSQLKANNTAPFGYKVVQGAYIKNEESLVCLLVERKEFTYIDVAKLIFDTFLKNESINQTARDINVLFGILSLPKNDVEETSHVIKDGDIVDIEIKTNKHVPMYFPKMTIRNLLVNPVFAGGTPYDTHEKLPGEKKYRLKPYYEWQINWGTHEGIISVETHEKIKAIIQSNRNNRWNNATDKKWDINPYSGILKCSHCGGGLARQKHRPDKNGTMRYRYQCSKYRQKTCVNKRMVLFSDIDRQVGAMLSKEALKLTESLKNKDELLSKDTIPESDELKTLKQSLKVLLSMPRNDILDKTIEQYENKIRELTNVSSQVATHNSDLANRFLAYMSMDDFWVNLSLADKQRFLKEFVSKITVDAPYITNLKLSFQ